MRPQKARLLATLLAATLLGAPSLAERRAAPRCQGLEPGELNALRSLHEPSLLELVAGAGTATEPLDSVARARLLGLERQHPELEDLRAGDMSLSNKELTTILLVLGIVLILIIIL